MHLCRLLLLCATCAGIVSAQLYLVAGSPTPKDNARYATTLLRVTADGSLKTVSSLGGGSYWMSLSYDWRKLVILPLNPDQRIKVLDLNTASIVKECIDPPAPIGGLVDQWLINSPSKGQVFVEHLIGDDVLHGQLRGIIVDPGVPCEASFVSVDPGDSRFFSSSGTAGLLDIGGASEMTAHMDKDGRVYTWISSVTTYFDQIPKPLVAGIGHPGGGIIVNNNNVMILGVGDGDDPSNQRLLFFRKSDRTWGRVPVSTEHVAWTRGFGSVIAVAEAQIKNDQHRASAGQELLRSAPSANGPHMRGKFEQSQVAYPGRLHLYDVSTNKLYTITTGQGDSEVLLVEGNDVYYRVVNRLYHTTMTTSSLPAGQVVATDEQIRDVHWAFTRP